MLSLIDYYEYSGDKDGVKELPSEATDRLNHAYQIWGTNPNLRFMGWDERLGEVLKSVTVLTITNDTAQLALSPVPKGFTVTATDSSNPDVIAVNGKVPPADTAAEVTLTLAVSDGRETNTKTVTVQVPAK